MLVSPRETGSLGGIEGEVAPLEGYPYKEHEARHPFALKFQLKVHWAVASPAASLNHLTTFGPGSHLTVSDAPLAESHDFRSFSGVWRHLD